jgi:hypothetical protein
MNIYDIKVVTVWVGSLIYTLNRKRANGKKDSIPLPPASKLYVLRRGCYTPPYTVTPRRWRPSPN